MKRNDQLKTDSHIGIIVKIIKFTIKLLTHSVKHIAAEGETNRQFPAHLKLCLWSWGNFKCHIFGNKQTNTQKYSLSSAIIWLGRETTSCGALLCHCTE